MGTPPETGSDAELSRLAREAAGAFGDPLEPGPDGMADVLVRMRAARRRTVFGLTGLGLLIVAGVLTVLLVRPWSTGQVTGGGVQTAGGPPAGAGSDEKPRLQRESCGQKHCLYG